MPAILVAVILLMTLLVGALGKTGEAMINALYSSPSEYLMSSSMDELGVELKGDAWLDAAEQSLPSLKSQLEAQYESLEHTEGGFLKFMERNMVQMVQRQVDILEYRVQNRLAPENTSTTWNFAMVMGILGNSLIMLFVLIIGAGSMAGEYTEGTIKMLIPRPYRRWKILMAKILATIGYGLILVVLAYGVSLLCGGVLYGFEGGNAAVVGYNGTAAFQGTAFGLSLGTFLMSALSLFAYLGLATMLSCLIRSRAVAVGVSLLVMFVAGSVAQMFAMLGADFLKYSLFMNTDLSVYYLTGPMMPGMTVGLSTIILLLHALLFFVLAFVGFCRRDI